MLAHYEACLRQCTNPSMTAKLQDLARDVRETFRGDSKKTKGPEAFKLMKSEMEALETTLRDEEATQTRKTVKFNFTAESGVGDPSMAAAARSSEKWPVQPCYFADSILPQDEARRRRWQTGDEVPDAGKRYVRSTA